MARIRTIKPSFFKNEHIAEIPMSTRLLFIGLWCLADREGRLEDRPKRIKVELFPYDSLEIDQQLSRLQSAGFIYRYEVGEMKVIQIINFLKHQRITGTEAESTSELPECNDIAYQETLRKQLGNNLETTRTTGKGKDIGKGYRERSNGKLPPPTLEEVREYVKSRGCVEHVADRFFSHYDVAGWQDSRGKPVLNWKQKFISVWERDEVKEKAPPKSLLPNVPNEF